MGQKVNSNALRLHINKNWNSQSHLDLYNYNDVLVQDLFIQNYIKSVLFKYNIFCTNIVIKRIDNFINIYIYFYNDKLFSLLWSKGNKQVNNLNKFNLNSTNYCFKNYVKFKKRFKNKAFLEYLSKKKLINSTNIKETIRKNFLSYSLKNLKLNQRVSKPLYKNNHSSLIKSNLKNFNLKLKSKDYRFKNYVLLKKKFLKTSNNLDHYSTKKYFYNNRMFFNNSLKKIIFSNLNLLVPDSYLSLNCYNTFHCNRKMIRFLKRRSTKYRLPLNSKHSLMFLLCFWTALLYKSSNLICQYLSLIFKLYIKRCFRFLNALKIVTGAFFKKCNLKGIKISFKGCLNDRRRSRNFSILWGRIPTQTLSSRISFSQTDCLTIYGVCGIKVWIHY